MKIRFINSVSSQNIKSAVFTMFITVIICSFLYFSMLAINNTSTVMYGRDMSLIKIRYSEDADKLTVYIAGEANEIDISGLNKAFVILDKNFEFIPAPLAMLVIIYKKMSNN